MIKYCVPSDELFMQRCIELARQGKGDVAPNPMVGCVIVHNGKIIGEGYHKRFGEAHAEVNAIYSVEDQELLKESTVYVSLEPCAHHGKTPPCSDLLVKSAVKKVVIGCRDPHLKVSGKGIEKLKKAGIEVVESVLEKECRELNKRFFTFHEKQRPYVILKWAQSADGFLDGPRQNNEKGILWISSPETRSLVHKWRSEEASILVGRRTVENDNPSLTVRDFHGKNPLRLIIDSQLKISGDLNIMSNEAPTIIFNRSRNEKSGSIEYVKIPETSTRFILEELYKRDILSVIVEGGSRTLQYFIFDNVWDEARVIVGSQMLVEGKRAPSINRVPTSSYSFSGDKIYLYHRK
ncbi:MAG: bifunctional diaminohydroxyphosphoribosylaminopyrimidine deaminase/5-amino-6-(5-phosphoribosylamino)uracil reductase RibD [Bacteroidota bacterium]|jgi:diaminohydroxyphosphoribosylaminopyrimidine deaminase/5-amino-6-(5-phosphoribosylamino)uracil reductase